MTDVRSQLALSVILLTINCATLFAQGAPDLNSVLEWQRTIELEETDEVFVVNPEIRVASDRLVVADESQIRLYDQEGTLLMRFGEEGDQAPGTLQIPRPAVQLSSEKYVVPSALTGNVDVFNAEGTFVERYTRVVASAGTNEAALLPNNEVLLVGASEVEGGGASPLLHRFDPETGETRASFFPHPTPLGEYEGFLYSLGDIASVDIRSERIAATFAVRPDIYLFDLQGDPVGQIEVSLSEFRGEKPAPFASRPEWREAMQEHSFVSDVFWFSDDVLLVQYYDFEEFSREGSVRNWRLAAVNLDGEVLFEWVNTPRLFGIHPGTQELYFQDPAAELPNRLKVGQFSEGVL